jgi:hypothetical protein
LNPVAPPITFKNPNIYPTLLGPANASATINVTLNKALHAYDYDTNGYIVIQRIINQGLTTGTTFSIQWYAFITNYTDPNSIGVVLQEIQVNINNNPNWVSITYFGGNTVYLSGPGLTTPKTYTLDMSIAHTFNITISRPKTNRLSIYYYIDNNLAYSYNYAITKTANVVIYSVEGGRYSTSNTYDLYIDNVRMKNVNNIITSEDFESGTDNFFINSYSSGNAGKTVVYYTFPKIFLLAYNNDTKSYACKLSIAPLTAPIIANFYIKNTTSTSTSILIKNTVITSETSEILLGSNAYVYMYLNITAPLTATLPITFNLQYTYHPYNSYGITVTYPITITYG